MIYSMTAFARVEKTTSHASIQWEIKSVNHRFLETQIRLPEALRDMESDLKGLVRCGLSRGKVDCVLKLNTAETNHGEINQTELDLLLGSIKQIRKSSSHVAKPSALDILRWPGVVSASSKPGEELRAEIKATFQAALEQLAEHRSREGKKLKLILQNQLDEVSVLIAEVRNVMEGVGAARHAALLKKIGALDLNINPERLEQEIVMLVQRADVMEEMDRLEIQVSETRSALENTGPHGRRLDFLMQELNREANTLGSKSVLPKTTQISVDLKVIIEQIREQVQNIE